MLTTIKNINGKIATINDSDKSFENTSFFFQKFGNCFCKKIINSFLKNKKKQSTENNNQKQTQNESSRKTKPKEKI